MRRSTRRFLTFAAWALVGSIITAALVVKGAQVLAWIGGL